MRKTYDQGIFPDNDLLLVYDVSTSSGQSKIEQVMVGLQSGIFKFGRFYCGVFTPKMTKPQEPTNLELAETAGILTERIMPHLGLFGYVLPIDPGSGRKIQERVDVLKQIAEMLANHMPQSYRKNLESLLN